MARGTGAAAKGKELNRKVGKFRTDSFPIFPAFLFQTFHAKSSRGCYAGPIFERLTIFVVLRITSVVQMSFPLPMKRIPRISDTEWEIMRIVWAQHPITAADIIARLSAADSTWHPKTARALLARLVEKKALEYEARGRNYLYAPRVTEAECVAAASGSFVERVFGGALKPMLAHFIEQRRLTREELGELRGMLDAPRGKSTTLGKKKEGKKP